MSIRGLLLLLLLLALLTVSLLHLSSSTDQENEIIVNYTQGLVIIHVFNVSKVILIGNGVSNLSVSGSNYNIQGNIIYLYGNEALIKYYTNFSKGTVSINETFASYITIILPSSYKIIYLSSPPLSYISNSVQNITFYGNKVYVVFSEATLSSENSQNQLLFILTIAGIVLSITTTSFIVYQLLTSRSRVRVSESDVSIGDELDERDIQVMKSLKNGASNITKLAEETNIPRTTVYRRLRRLIKLGYVSEIREKNKVMYVLTDKGKEFIEKMRGK
ncbi:MAG: helix-turn-helix domain-containing protein [Sulfolobaceae archaeon]